MPRIQMTSTVKFALWLLRIYLLILLSLIALKFTKGSGDSHTKSARVMETNKVIGDRK